MNIFQVKKYCLQIKNKYQNKLKLHILYFEKQTDIQVRYLRSLDLSNKNDELKQI